jgi:flagellar hook-basal body complex protein FliE
MDTFFIAPLQAAAAAAAAEEGLPLATPRVAASGFGDWIVQEAGTANRQLLAAEAGIRQVAAGEAISLHDVMIRLEEARHSLQFLVQVRNRLLEAYQDVMRTQV